MALTELADVDSAGICIALMVVCMVLLIWREIVMASKRRAEGGVAVEEEDAKHLNRSVRERNRLEPHARERKPCMNCSNKRPSLAKQASNIQTMLDASLTRLIGEERGWRAQW